MSVMKPLMHYISHNKNKQFPNRQQTNRHYFNLVCISVVTGTCFSLIVVFSFSFTDFNC